MTGKTVREATLATAVTVHKETPLSTAEALLIEARSSEVYVTDQAGQLLGIIPDYVFIKRRLLNSSTVILARHIMSPLSITLSPSSSLEEAAALLRQNIHARIPVVVNRRVIGQVTRTSVLQALAQQPEDLHTATDQPDWFSPLKTDAIPTPKFISKKLTQPAVE